MPGEQWMHSSLPARRSTTWWGRHFPSGPGQQCLVTRAVVLGDPSKDCAASLVRARQGVSDRFRLGQACATCRKVEKGCFFVEGLRK